MRCTRLCRLARLSSCLPTINSQGDARHGRSTATDDPDRLPAGAELLQLCRLLASPGDRARLPVADVLPGASPAHSRRAVSISPSSTTGWRMPDILGDDYRAAVENGIRVVKMDPSTILTVMGAGDREARSRLDLFDHLLRAVPCRPRVPDARPDDRRPRRLERRDVAQRPARRATSATWSTWSTTCATIAPTSSWRSCSAIGTAGTTTPSSPIA